MSRRCELLIGCGSNREKKLSVVEHEEWNGLVTLDNYAGHKPDKLHDLEKFPWPFEDNSVDELHGYEVIEHCSGQQGDYRAFFQFFAEAWRILKPNGLLLGTVPRKGGNWDWDDPGHRRVITANSFVFLNQPQYETQIGKTAMSDYRFCYRADFDLSWVTISVETFEFILQAIKPSRVTI